MVSILIGIEGGGGGGGGKEDDEEDNYIFYLITNYMRYQVLPLLPVIDA